MHLHFCWLVKCKFLGAFFAQRHTLQHSHDTELMFPRHVRSNENPFHHSPDRTRISSGEYSRAAASNCYHHGSGRIKHLREKGAEILIIPVIPFNDPKSRVRSRLGNLRRLSCDYVNLYNSVYILRTTGSSLSCLRESFREMNWVQKLHLRKGATKNDHADSGSRTQTELDWK